MADLSFINWVQQFSPPVVVSLFRWITMLGDQEYYMVVIPLLYWLWNKHFGIRFSLVFVTSIYLNSALKYNFLTERPDAAVRLVEADGFSFPSGHAQGNTVFWGYLARELHRRWAYWVAAVLIILVAFSRVYLGVHFPIDVIAGILIGLLILVGFEFLQTRYALKFDNRRYFLFTGGAVLLLYLNHSFGHAPVVLGYILAALWGYRLETQLIGFTESAPWPKQLVKAVIGVGVLFGLRVVTRTLFVSLPGIGEDQELLLSLTTFLRYFVIGFWITFVAPWLFKVLKLYRVEKAPG